MVIPCSVAPERIWKGHRSAAKRRTIFLVVPVHFLALKAQLVVLVSAFVMVSTVWSVFYLLFFYSRCPPCPAICKSGGGGTCPRSSWSRGHWPCWCILELLWARMKCCSDCFFRFFFHSCFSFSLFTLCCLFWRINVNIDYRWRRRAGVRMAVSDQRTFLTCVRSMTLWVTVCYASAN